MRTGDARSLGTLGAAALRPGVVGARVLRAACGGGTILRVQAAENGRMSGIVNEAFGVEAACVFRESAPSIDDTGVVALSSTAQGASKASSLVLLHNEDWMVNRGFSDYDFMRCSVAHCCREEGVVMRVAVWLT